jgi:hypothetical protein
MPRHTNGLIPIFQKTNTQGQQINAFKPKLIEIIDLCNLNIQSVPQREHNSSPLQRPTG